MVINMFFKIRAQKKAVAPQPQPGNADRSIGRDQRVHNQMFILMLSSITIFLITTLPLTIDHIVSSYTITDLSAITKLMITTTILNWIQTLNCAVSFLSISIYKTYYKNIIIGQFLRTLSYVYIV